MTAQPQIDYEQLATALLANQVKTKAVSSTPSAHYAHGGKGGLFSAPGLSRPLFSAMVLPTSGLASILPVRTSNETNPLYGIVTGVTDPGGSEPTGVCDDPPVSGLTKLCTHSFVFGRLSRQTKVFDIDRAGKIINRSDFLDFQLYGDPFRSSASNPLAPQPLPSPADIARNEIAKATFELAVTWARQFARLTWTGTPANNTAQGGYMEFYGLETLVNTGYRDALTGVVCPAADSIVRDFASADVGSNGANAVRRITNVYRNLKFLATHAGLDPVDWVIAMRFGLFYELTEVWPCAYLSYRCQTGWSGTGMQGGNVNVINSSDEQMMRNDMRGDLYNYTGQYLLIDGQKVRVILDDSIPETDAGGAFVSDMYFLPMTVLGNIPVTFWESFNYDGPGGPLELARAFAPADSYYTTDGGRFLWHKKPPTNFCVQLLAKTEPRLLLLTPYLAARYQNFKYQPIEHERDWDPDVTSYYKDGGQTDQDTFTPSYYSPTNQ